MNPHDPAFDPDDPATWTEPMRAYVHPWAWQVQRMTAGQVVFARLYAVLGKARESAARAGYSCPKQAATRLVRHPDVRQLIYFLTSGENPRIRQIEAGLRPARTYDPNSPEDMAELAKIDREIRQAERAERRAERAKRWPDGKRPIRWRRDHSAFWEAARRAREGQGGGE